MAAAHEAVFLFTGCKNVTATAFCTSAGKRPALGFRAPPPPPMRSNECTAGAIERAYVFPGHSDLSDENGYIRFTFRMTNVGRMPAVACRMMIFKQSRGSFSECLETRVI